ncbi:MAG: selenocysteine-specific translation elongation factor [Bryobacteraceae bacterium]
MKNDAMKSIVVGTVGHIDHGKTALVRALTGIDTDRLAEEKRRGISIDLGFAHLNLNSNLRLSFVDVPGHEKFIKNMLAGIGGIDMVLLVIAADESIKPQTREHFDICKLLTIPKGIIVLTKADLVDADILALARMEAEEFVRDSFLDGAPIVSVSATTGAGLDELRAQLAALAADIQPKDGSRYVRLPVDRVFSLHGIGTVVTGTLMAGSVAPEDELELHPGGKLVRVRGVQVHGQPAGRASAGERAALNLTGLERRGLARGMVLAAPAHFHATRTVDAAFDLLVSSSPLKHRAPVHFHSGAAAIEAEVRLLGGPEPVQPGSHAYVRFSLRDPVLLLPGDRFIVRRFSPVVTIGGGVILDINPPAKIRRDEGMERLRILETASFEEVIALVVRESLHGLSLPELIARTGLTAREIEAAASGPSLVAIREPRFRLLDQAWVEAKLDRIRGLLRAFHKENPLVSGMPKETLRSSTLPHAPVFVLDAILHTSASLAQDGDIVRLSAHQVALGREDEEALRKIEGAFELGALAVPATADVLAASGVDPARARTLLQILLRNRKLIRIGENLVFHHAAIDGLRGRMVRERGRRFGIAEFKEWTGVSRKYAIPLLEYLDRERVTRRDGGARIVL